MNSSNDIDLRTGFYSANSSSTINSIKTSYTKIINNASVIRYKKATNIKLLKKARKDLEELPKLLTLDEKRRHKFNKNILDELCKMFNSMQEVVNESDTASHSTVSL